MQNGAPTSIPETDRAKNVRLNMPSTHRPGSWPVMITPFDSGKRIDWVALDALIEWYIAAGSQGLFATCLSSELFHLDADERSALVRRVLSRASTRLPVIAAGAFAPNTTATDATGTPTQIADAAHRLADTGIESVIFLTNQFAAPDDNDATLLTNLEATLARLDPAIPVGLYECPVPYKRLLTPALTEWAACTGRFRFLKDTCCDLSQIKAKLSALHGSPLRFYNANTPTLLASLQAGGHGFSGIGANAMPHLYTWHCEHFAKEPGTARELQQFLTDSSAAVDTHYPHSVKAYLHLNGLPIQPVSRVSQNELTRADNERLRRFHVEVIDWEKRLGLASPFEALANDCRSFCGIG
ncbi:MAG: hypothetical protein B9S32_09000 [Verrucomicrobia bacterium Tous-C9LFEB]|nr:MAG: hypothetical protein B9S32_09000 [Verrucomicrobia bacterium Tous-C9LFEB]